MPAFLLQALTSNKVRRRCGAARPLSLHLGHTCALLTTHHRQVLTFYLLRVLLALVCAACQAALCIAVQLRFGSATAKSLRTLMVFSTGMFIASTGAKKRTIARVG